MLQLNSVTKRYGGLIAVDQLSLAVRRGEFFGLLGPNGAGKSTTMSLIVGLKAPDSGTLILDGRPVNADSFEQRQKIGFVPQSIALYEDLTAEENLRIFGRLYRLDRATLAARIEEGLRAVQLHDRRRDKVKTFSGGMQRRLNLVAALLHRPQLLLCDEPTVGVDPQSRNAIFEFLQARSAEGLTVIYSTHYMEEAARLCSRIGIIDHGKILALGMLDELLTRLPSNETLRILKTATTAGALDALTTFGTLSADGDEAHALALRPGARLSEVFAVAEHHAIPSTAFQLERPTLEDVFLHLTGKSLRE